MTLSIDKEMGGHLFWDRVLTSKPKYARYAITPRGKSIKPVWEGKAPLQPAGEDLPWLLQLASN